MREKKVLVSVRCPQWIVTRLEHFQSIWRFRDKSKTINYALAFFLEHVSPEDWELYWRAPGSKVKEAWDAFWSVIRSTGVESNT